MRTAVGRTRGGEKSVWAGEAPKLPRCRMNGGVRLEIHRLSTFPTEAVLAIYI